MPDVVANVRAKARRKTRRANAFYLAFVACVSGAWGYWQAPVRVKYIEKPPRVLFVPPEPCPKPVDAPRPHQPLTRPTTSRTAIDFLSVPDYVGGGEKRRAEKNTTRGRKPGP